MASVRSCVSVKPTVSPVKYRSTRVGAATLGAKGRLQISSSSTTLALGADGCRDAGCASSSGRGDVNGAVGLLGDGGRIRRGQREVVAMCSASFDGVRPCAPAAAVASAVPPASASAFPERAKVVTLVAAIMLLCNADRVVMSVAVVPLAAQHGWSSSFVGIVQSSFLWGYVFSSMVGGALADRYGGKKVMAGAAALWSLATFLTPWAASRSTIMLLAMRALFGLAEGASADFLIKSGFSTALVRKIMQSIGFMGPGVSLLCLRFAQTPSVAAALMTIALSLSSFSQAGYFCNVQDIAPKYAGSLHGLTNGIGTVAAIVSTIGTGYFVQWLGSFQAFLTLTAALYFSATIFYNTYATGDLIFDCCSTKLPCGGSAIAVSSPRLQFVGAAPRRGGRRGRQPIPRGADAGGR